MSQTAAAKRRPTWLGYLTSTVGIALLILIAPFYFSAGLVAPWWAMVLLLGVWLVLLVLSTHFYRRRPFLVLAFPFMAAAFWVLLIYVGGGLLDWTP